MGPCHLALSGASWGLVGPLTLGWGEPLLFGRKDSEPIGETLVSIPAESGPGDIPLAVYLIHRYTDTPKIDILGQWLMLYSAAMLNLRSCLEDPTLLLFGSVATLVDPEAYLWEPRG